MSTPPTPPTPTPPPPRRWWVYPLTAGLAAVGTILIAALLANIMQRQEEGKQYYLPLVKVDDNDVDPEKWGVNFPRQLGSYRRTVDNQRTKHGGSEAFNKLEQEPRLKLLYAGYAFSIDFREERGHAFMLKDQDDTLRVKLKKQPGACLHCHASVIPAYREVGATVVAEDKKKDDWQVILAGFHKVCAMDWKEARSLVKHPVSCVDCHDPKTMHLRATRPAFILAMQELAKSDDPLPHLESINRWRTGNRSQPYDVNALATRQEMRSFVCGQCHVEYYFKKDSNLLTYPWHKGLKVEQIEAYYDSIDFSDWVHEKTQAKVLKAQHPEFELWNQGIHARSGVSCADCHMPYVREGAVKVSDHHIRSPLLNVNRACQTCHRYEEKEILARAEAVQGRTVKLLDRSYSAVTDLITSIEKGLANGVPAARLEAARKLQRQAQWRLDFISAENSHGFHASQESARILAEAIDYARQGQIELLKK